MFHDPIRQMLINIPNILSISNNVLMYAKPLKAHDANLEH